MLRISISLLLALTISQFGTAQNVWIQKDSVQGPPKSACVAFAGSAIGYIGLGFDQFDYKRSLFAYNPAFDAWDKLESLGGELSTGLNRSSATAFVINGNAYVGTGQGINPYFGDIWAYNLSTNTWTQKADFGGTPRTEAVGFTANNMGYIGTGKDVDGLTNDFWKYDPTANTWSVVASLPGSARKQAVAVSMGASAYVGTGDNGTFTGDFYKYVAATDTWSSISSFAGTPRYGAVAFAIYPNVFVGTGYDNTLNYTKDFWSYNILNDTWTSVLDFPGTARSNATAFVVGSSGFVGTGYDGQALDDFYEYVPLLSVLQKSIGKSIAYPNPTSDDIRIKLEEPLLNKDLNICIYTISGKQILEQIFLNDALINCSHFRNGTYSYLIRNNETVIKSGQFSVIHE